jgi:hypothetical protein
LSCFAFHWKNAITVAMRLVLEEPLTCSYSWLVLVGFASSNPFSTGLDF